MCDCCSDPSDCWRLCVWGKAVRTDVCACLNLRYKLKPEAVSQSQQSLDALRQKRFIWERPECVTSTKLWLYMIRKSFPEYLRHTSAVRHGCPQALGCVRVCVISWVTDPVDVCSRTASADVGSVKMENCLRLYWKLIFNTLLSFLTSLTSCHLSPPLSLRVIPPQSISSSSQLFLNLLHLPSVLFSSPSTLTPLFYSLFLLFFSPSIFSLSLWWFSVCGIRNLFFFF